MSKVIRLDDQTQELLIKTKTDYIESLRKDFNAAAERNLIDECIEIDRLIKETAQDPDSRFLWRCIHAFRVLTDIDEKI